MEDRLRFDRSLPSFPGRWKSIRHEVLNLRQEIERNWGPIALWRDVANDPGAPHPAQERRPHADADAVLKTNLARAREAARSVEESLRAALPSLSTLAEQIRYAIYEAEGAALGLIQRHGRRSTSWLRRSVPR